MILTLRAGRPVDIELCIITTLGMISLPAKHFHIAQTEHWHVQDELMKCLKPVFYQEHKDIYSGLHSLHSRPDPGRHWLASFHSLIPANGLITTHTKHIKEKPDRMSTSGHATDCHT